ncbi:MAG: carbon-nitrogen hydrolase family protein [Pirellulales bacterium]|nr:carbon-nitrogen hydrolase family protein [Pirellulales bacterium]
MKLAIVLGAVWGAAATSFPASGASPETFLAGWQAAAPREEIRPAFAYDASGGPQRSGALVIATGASVAEHGWFQKAFPVTGGNSYRFEAARKAENVAVPRRSAPVRIVWLDAVGKAVLADPPAGQEKESGRLPLAEPEHPLDGPADRDGWTSVPGVYRAPIHATQAVVELHLQWSPRGRVAWSGVTLAECSPPPSRKVRLATVHYVPTGKAPRMNCEEYAPLIADAAGQQANLVVLGETVPYVRVGKKPHEVAEPVPGPSTEYFGELARKHQLHIVLSLYEREETAVYNTAVLLGPDGRLIGKYRKVCLPHSEIESGVTPGDSYPVFETALGKVAMMICYDGFFPEVARELTNRGAEIIAWPVWGCNPLLAQARACENHVYVVSSTYADAKSNWMISAVFDHAGQPVAKADRWGQVAVAEVDLGQRYFWRNNLGDFHAMAQRHRPAPTPEPAAMPGPSAAGPK